MSCFETESVSSTVISDEFDLMARFLSKGMWRPRASTRMGKDLTVKVKPWYEAS